MCIDVKVHHPCGDICGRVTVQVMHNMYGAAQACQCDRDYVHVIVQVTHLP